MRLKHQVFAMKLANVYPPYIQRAECKNRTKEEVGRCSDGRLVEITSYVIELNEPWL